MEFAQKVIAYLQGDESVKLSAQEIQKYNRCKELNFWIREHGMTKAMNMAVMDFELSERQVRRLVNDTIKIYGDDKGLTKSFLVAIAFDNIVETRSAAKELGDVKNMAVADKNLLTLIKNHFSDVETPDFEKLQPKQTVVVFKPELLGIEQPSEEEIDKAIRLLSTPKRKKELFVDAIDTDYKELGDE